MTDTEREMSRLANRLLYIERRCRRIERLLRWAVAAAAAAAAGHGVNFVLPVG